MTAGVSCDAGGCTPRSFPRFQLTAFRTVPSGGLVVPGELCIPSGVPCGPGFVSPFGGLVIAARSGNANANYQYITVENVAAEPILQRFDLRVLDWDGLPSSGFGIAWSIDQ
jgi:hypothetical protein